MEIEQIRTRTDAIREERQQDIQNAELREVISSMNSFFGEHYEQLHPYMLNTVTDAVLNLGIYIDAEYLSTVEDFFNVLDGIMWADISAEDIKMAGDLICSLLGNRILYDSGSFSFYLSTEDSPSWVYARLKADWERLPFWRKIVYSASKPKLTLPPNIPASKAI